VKAFLDRLVRRRGVLVERSVAQREQLAAAVGDLRRATIVPVVLGAGAAATLPTSSPKLRQWMVRGWAAYALVRRLLGR
jgi:hypothetical protein